MKNHQYILSKTQTIRDVIKSIAAQLNHWETDQQEQEERHHKAANDSFPQGIADHQTLARYQAQTNIFTDMMFSSVKSSRENTCEQIYCNDLQWTAIYPIKSKGEVHLSLSSFLSTQGAPDLLRTDGVKELTEGKFRRKAREAGVHCKEVEPYSGWSNMAEAGIRELKHAT
jgi:hypothetical protein